MIKTAKTFHQLNSTEPGQIASPWQKALGRDE